MTNSHTHASRTLIALLMLCIASTCVHAQEHASVDEENVSKGLAGGDATGTAPVANDELDAGAIQNQLDQYEGTQTSPYRTPTLSEPRVIESNPVKQPSNYQRPRRGRSFQVPRFDAPDFPPQARRFRQTRVESLPDSVDMQDIQSIRATVTLLRQSKDEKTRSAAAEKLKKLLETTFDRDYERRNRQLVELEQRVAKLRSQLDRRKKSRDDVIDVRVKSLLYEAEGIGFPGFGDAWQPIEQPGMPTAPQIPSGFVPVPSR